VVCHHFLLLVTDATMLPASRVARATHHPPTTATANCDPARLRLMPTAPLPQPLVSTREPCTHLMQSLNPASNGSTTPQSLAEIRARQYCRQLVSSHPNAHTHFDRLPSHSGPSASRASNASQNGHGCGVRPATKKRLWKRTKPVFVISFSGYTPRLIAIYTLYYHHVLLLLLSRACCIFLTARSSRVPCKQLDTKITATCGRESLSTATLRDTFAHFPYYDTTHGLAFLIRFGLWATKQQVAAFFSLSLTSFWLRIP
jgi:hypothetical protein